MKEATYREVEREFEELKAKVKEETGYSGVLSLKSYGTVGIKVKAPSSNWLDSYDMDRVINYLLMMKEYADGFKFNGYRIQG